MNGDDSEQVWGPGLQPERTSLAWRRVALALLGLALAVPNLGWPLLGIWALVPAGAVAAGALTLLGVAHRRYLRTHHLFTVGSAQTMPDGQLPLIAVLTSLILAMVAVVIVVTRAT